MTPTYTFDPTRALMKEADRLVQRFGTGGESSSSLRINSRVAEFIHRTVDPLRRFKDGEVFPFAGVPVTIDNNLADCIAVSFEAPLAVAE